MKTILVDALQTFILEIEGKFEMFVEMYELLETFPDRKIIVTNANKEEAKSVGLDKAPYEIFSLEHSPNKTDPKFFETLLSHYNLTPDQVIYFEHNPEAVKSAESVGIVSYYYDSENRDLGALRKFIEENLV